MTEVVYEVTSNDGQHKSIVKTLSEAERLANECGGRYKEVFNYYETFSEAFAQTGHRVGGKQNAI